MAVIFKDDFASGLGQWTAVAIQGTAAITSGQMRFSPNGTAVFGVLGMYSNSTFTGASGMTLSIDFGAATNTIGTMFGFQTVADTIAFVSQKGIYYANPGTEIYKNDSGQSGTGNLWAADTTYTTLFTVGASSYTCKLTGGGYTATTVFTDTVTLPGTDFQIAFDVNTFYAAGYAGVDNVILTDNGSLAPTAPSSPTATVLSQTSIKIDYTDNGTATSETGVSIERSLTSGSGFSEIATVSQGVATYTNTGLTAATQYYYRMRGYLTFAGTTTYSSYTSEVSGTTTGTGPTNGQILLVLGELP